MIKTRFAPSPTGHLHIGNIRTALFAYLYARHTGGKFILRIEDTDLERSHEDYTKALMEDMRWLGLDWDEGPEAGGPNGPYHQSERLGIYKEYAEKLVSEGRAYYCYCSEEEIEERKAKLEADGKPPHYDGKCRHLSASERKTLEAEGRVPVIRFWSYEEDFEFDDVVKGTVKFPKGMVGDFVILRSNGLPLYNFAVVIDDMLMEVSHVLRADEHLSNTVRQLMIYKACGAKPPIFAHMALVLGPDKKKLSKRHGATSVDEFRKMGYLPESLLNYLALLGWSSPDGREILNKDELIKLFDLDRLSTSPAIFDPVKLDWIAKHDVLNSDIDRIFDLSLPYIMETGLIDDKYLSDAKNRDFLKGVVQLTRGYCSRLSQIKEHIDYFLNDGFEIHPDAMAFLKKETSAPVIKAFRELVLKDGGNIGEEQFVKIADEISKRTGVKGKNLFMPLRAALTGRPHGPEIYFLIPVIGSERTVKRLDRALELIG
jgi:glutamyl-tRNA synthetase